MHCVQRLTLSDPQMFLTYDPEFHFSLHKEVIITPVRKCAIKHIFIIVSLLLG